VIIGALYHTASPLGEQALDTRHNAPRAFQIVQGIWDCGGEEKDTIRINHGVIHHCLQKFDVFLPPGSQF